VLCGHLEAGAGGLQWWHPVQEAHSRRVPVLGKRGTGGVW
jgi:hypothetical protein